MKYRSCKDCPQYERCVTTSNLAIKRKHCEFADNSRNKKPLTHFDRIKAMSVEEMAEFLMDWFTDCMTGKAPMNVQKWLESEVQENEKKEVKENLQ